MVLLSVYNHDSKYLDRSVNYNWDPSHFLCLIRLIWYISKQTNLHSVLMCPRMRCKINFNFGLNIHLVKICRARSDCCLVVVCFKTIMWRQTYLTELCQCGTTQLDIFGTRFVVLKRHCCNQIEFEEKAKKCTCTCN